MLTENTRDGQVRHQYKLQHICNSTDMVRNNATNTHSGVSLCIINNKLTNLNNNYKILREQNF